MTAMRSPKPPLRAMGRWPAAAFVVCALIAGLYAPVLLGRAHWSSEQFTERVAPAQVAASQALRRGAAPWWWDEPGFGAPLAAVAAHAAWSPTTALATSEAAAARLALAHLALLALALLALAHRLAVSPTVALAAALLVAGGASRWPEHLAVAAWAALVALAIASLRGPSARGTAWRWWALAVALAMVVASGSVGVAVLGAGLAAALLAERRRVALAVLAAFGVSAAQWLPAVLSEEVALGDRIGARSMAAVAAVVAVVAAAWWARRMPGWARLGALALAGVAALWLRGPLSARAPLAVPLAPSGSGVAPVRVFCPTPVPAAQATAGPTTQRALALDPGRALTTEEARAAGWRCVPGRGSLGADERELWRRGGMAGGRLLRRWAVGYALVPRSTVVAAGFHELAALATWSLVAVPARPVAAVYAQWVAVPDAAAARRHLLEELQRGDWLLVEMLGPSQVAAPPSIEPAPEQEAATDDGHGHSDEAAPPPLAGPVAEPCAISRWQPGDVTLRCRAGATALAAVALPYRPGWSVTLDGAPATRLRAEGVLSAVALPPGEHEVRWRYRPRGAAVAWRLSTGMGLLAAAAFVAMLLGRRRRRSETP